MLDGGYFNMAGCRTVCSRQRTIGAAKATLPIALAFVAGWAHAAAQNDSGSPVVGYLIAISPILASFAVYWLTPVRQWVMRRLLARQWLGRPLVAKFWGTRRLSFGEANAATLAVSLIDGIDLKKGVLCIVGGDGYIGGEGKGPQMLEDAVKRWTRQGLTVRYLLFRSSGDALEKLTNLQRQAGDSLEVYVLKEAPQGFKEIVDVLETYHPNLICGTDKNGAAKKAMWIEGRHFPGADISYDNQWVPPKAMEKPVKGLAPDTDGNRVRWNAIFDTWQKKFEELLPLMQQVVPHGSPP